jgi:parallel beta helix pectate lyase-like protein
VKRLIGIVSIAVVLAGGVLAVCLVSRGPGSGPGTQADLVATSSSGAAPTTAGPVVCGNSSLLAGPSTAPAGAVTIAAGTNEASAGGQPNTTYWLAPGTHTLGSGQYDQLQPASGDVYEGAPGAVLNGENVNDYAFVSTATDVTIEYLTIENFVAPQSEGVVNQNSASNWTIQDDTIENNPNGAGAMLGTNNVLTHDCLTKNGQYGFQSYSSTGPHNVTITDNEISDNDTRNYTATTPGCGCTGGAKFWDTTGATITGNYIHDNESDGLWADTDNSGLDFADNYFADNYGPAIEYEISYNASITDNTFVGNAVGAGPTNPGFPEAAIYVSESGSDPRVAGPYGTAFDISGNVFTDNWSGVVLWENSNRYCGSTANTSTGYCTLVTPSTYTTTSCAANVPSSTPTGSPDYYDNCRWKTQNVDVSSNTFNFTPAGVAPDCTASEGCGYNGIFSEYGTYPPFTGWVVPTHISNHQNNHFTDNTYNGAWRFMGFTDGEAATWAQWTAGFKDTTGSGDTFDAQDAGSTYNGSFSVPPASTTTTTAPPSTTTTTAPKTTTTTTAPPSTTTTTEPPSTTTTTEPPSTTTTTAPKTTTTTTAPKTTTTTTAPHSSTSGAVPGAPKRLSAFAAPSAVSLSWQSPSTSTVTSYTVLRGTSSGAETPLATGVRQTSYTDPTAMSMGKSYYYTVEAVNGSGAGPASNQVWVLVTRVWNPVHFRF